ncbi:hypothetical protein [Streptomyces sp. SID14478]|uniref:hypothetical protein n=1 Tax=Streptomyces sp. SID14478 TaxID=2706073 RepID=UPI001EF24ED1|nr:hypothetical protein [Streptomyces sp. SID14478]
MRLLRSEDGIAKFCAVCPGSAFSDGLADYLDQSGVELVSWKEAKRLSFQLVVTCSVHPTMRQIDAPLMVLPHGAGYNRLVTESTGDRTSPTGLSRKELVHRGKVLPAVIGLSHIEQLTRLAQTCPEAVPRAHVVGDWCFQRTLESMDQRDHYRARLGATDGRRLVVIHSTWSEHSLLGRHPDLPLDLVTALPVDEFAVAAVLHPNVWARHPVSERLATAMDAGLMVIPPEEGWRAAIVASDWVIGDHGSTSFYSAAAERLVLLAATGLAELDPASPTAAFARTAPRIDPHSDLHEQLIKAELTHDPDLLKPILDGQLADIEKSGELTQTRMYSFLAKYGVRPPDAPPGPDPVPAPAPVRMSHPSTYDVTGTVQADGSVSLRRWPVVSSLPEEARGFYAVTDKERHILWSQAAEVFARTVAHAEVPAVDWCHRKARDLLGVNVLVARLDDASCLIRLGTGGLLLEAHAERPWGSPQPSLDPVLLGSAANLWLTSGRSADTLANGLRIRTGDREIRVTFVPRP